MGWALERLSGLREYITPASLIVYPMFIPDGDQIICKTYMTRVEGENTRLRHYLARLHRKTLCYSKSQEMLAYSVKLLIHYLKFWDVPVPISVNNFSRDKSRQIQ
jgi:insertion element IS1 protein InsB